MSKRIEEMFESDLKILRAEYEKDLSVPNKGTKGDAREDVLIRSLKKRLPTRYGLDSGHLITAGGDWGKQQDIIIYNKFECPLFDDLGDQKIIPVEAAIATIEVKSTLTSNELQDIFSKAANTRSLAAARKFLFPQAAEIPGILTVGFAFNSSITIEQINGHLREQTFEGGVDFLCVLEDKEGNAAFFILNQLQKVMLLPDNKGEPANLVLRKFLFEILLHLQRIARLSMLPDLSAYLGVFGLDKVARLQALHSRIFQGSHVQTAEVVEFVYLMGSVPGSEWNVIRDKDSVFMFEKKKNKDGTIDAEVWQFTAPDGRIKPMPSMAAWEAARKAHLGEQLSNYDEAIIKALIFWFNRANEKQEKLIIKPEPFLMDRLQHNKASEL